MSGLPINPTELSPARGFSHGILTGGGKVLHIAGETGHQQDMTLEEGFVAQFAAACRNVAAVIEEAGGSPTDLASLTVFVTSVGDYRDNLEAVGEAYRAVFGKHFPAMALVGVTELVDRSAVVEMMGTAIISD